MLPVAAPAGQFDSYQADGLVDRFGRKITYLRLSVTDRCDLRCVYCMSETMKFLPKADLLSLDELDRLCAAFVRRGIRKIRISGGEPLVRRDIMCLFRRLSRHIENHRLDEQTLTGAEAGAVIVALFAAAIIALIGSVLGYLREITLSLQAMRLEAAAS